jgi:molybdopterin converting factor small subunit
VSTVWIPTQLRALAGCERVRIDAKDVRGLLRALEARFPGFGEALGREYAVAIDGEILHDALLEPLGDESEVVFLPRISGGS